MPNSNRIEVDSETVSCDGGRGVNGHPIVYLKIGSDGRVLCPYCNREFVLRRDGAGQPGR